MAYNRSYYAHGAEPFAYQWHGRIQYPARDQSSLHGVGGLGSLGGHTLEKITLGEARAGTDLLDTKLDESGTKSKTDPRFVPYVQQVQVMLNSLLNNKLAADGNLMSALPRIAKVFNTSEARVAEMTWRQVITGVQSVMPKALPASPTPPVSASGMSTTTKIAIGAGALGLLFLLRKK